HTFDLATQIPLRATLFTLTPNEHILVLVVHHIAGDGWSMTPLARDISTAYTARHNGAEPGWEPLPVQYADYTLWQRDLLGTDDDPNSLLAQQLAYWRDALADIPEELELPYDRVRPAVATHRGASIPLTIPTELHQQLAELARTEGTTMFMVLQAALAVLLSKLGAGTDIPIGTPIAGRTDDALDNLVGFFVNTLVLRTDLTNNPTFTDLLARVRENSLNTYAHQDIPFERLVEDLAPTRSMARHPLFQVMLTLQNNSAVSLELPGLTITPLTTGQLPAKFDLSLTLGETFTPNGTPAGLHGELTYATDLFDPTTAEQITNRLHHLLHTLTNNPTTPLHDISVLDDAERQQVLTTWNDTAREVPTATLPQLFQAQA
ncbi:condensation domain-containing protein, partial [Kitasatospora sp. NPDC052896]|uniref:condensation domain-containing protein n=1 Tax=Kitasatospora sp. NPDC052896 TaxID=3364061 RepID=UPI0037CC9F16